MAQWKTRKKYKRLRTAKDRKPFIKEEMDTQDAEDTKLYKPRELLSCDNVGPVNPKSFKGYTQTFIWRDTATKRMFLQPRRGTGGDMTVLQDKRNKNQGHPDR